MAKPIIQPIPLYEEVANMKSKLQLMEIDRKTYYEITYHKLIKEYEKLMSLRKQVKELRQEYHEKMNTSELIAEQALQKNPKDRQNLMKYPADKAIDMMDMNVCDNMRRLNAMKYKTRQKKEKLMELEGQYTNLLIIAADTEDIRLKKGNIGQQIRDIENRLDKAILKQNEAAHVKNSYLKIRDLLQQEALCYDVTLSTIEKEIIKSEAELKEVRDIYKDAEFCKNRETVDLKRHEEFLVTELKRREIELANMKKVAQNKTIENNFAKISIPLNLDFEEVENEELAKAKLTVQDDNLGVLEEKENIFQMIKQSTGLSSLSQMVKRFQTQQNTQQSLQTLQNQLELDIEARTEEKVHFVESLLNLKYISEEMSNKYSNLRKDKESDLKSHYSKMQETLREVQDKQVIVSKIRFSIHHLMNKCDKKIDHKADLLDRNFYIKSLDKIANEIMVFLGELKCYNISEELARMKEEEEEIIVMPNELVTVIEPKLSHFNTRIQIPKKSEPNNHPHQIHESDSEPDEKTDRTSRNILKKQSTRIVEARSIRNMPAKSIK